MQSSSCSFSLVSAAQMEPASLMGIATACSPAESPSMDVCSNNAQHASFQMAGRPHCTFLTVFMSWAGAHLQSQTH